MASPTNQLSNLVDLASETSSEKRRELLESISGMFVQEPGAFSASETDLIGEIISRVADDVEVQVRERLSEQMADVENAPRELALKLANDVIAVAGPQLLRSKVLSDRDLLQVLDRHGKDHQMAISKRDIVSEMVSDALVGKGDDDILISLAHNHGAELSRDAMETMVTRSEEVEALQGPLVNRDDVDGDLKMDMYWFVSSALRDHIVEATGADESLVEQALKSAHEAMEDRARNAEALSAAERDIQRRVELGQLNEDYMVALLRGGEREQFLHAFSYLTDVTIDVAQRILADPGDEAVAIACRASEFELSTFSAIVLLFVEGDRTKEGDEVANLMDVYIKLPIDTAKRAMRFWRIRQKSKG